MKCLAYFWHVADFHLDLNYTNSGERLEKRDYFLGDYDYETCWGSSNPGKFGNYQCDAPQALLDEVSSFISSLTANLTGENGAKPFILWTG